MKTIWKYTLTPSSQKVQMPIEAKLLYVSEQHGEICIWAEVEDNLPTEERTFEVYGTGHSILEEAFISRKYIGTAKMDNGTYIFHVYEYINDLK